MKIIVFVKQVPDTDDVKLDPKTGNLCREGVKSMLNPLDANAVEAALQLREAHGGTVTAVTMGPPQAEEALKKAQVTLVSGISVEDGWARCERELGSIRQTVRVKLPAAVTVCGSINKPRYATPINIMRALKKPRTTWNAADLGCDTAKTGVPGSPSCTKRVFEPEKLSADTVYLSGSPADMARTLVAELRDRHLI